MFLCSVVTKEYQDALSRITAVVEKHKKGLVPGVAQLNMCDMAVMVRSIFHRMSIPHVSYFLKLVSYNTFYFIVLFCGFCFRC